MKSEFAARLAVEMGYTDVYWYKEGIKGWKKAGLPLGTTIKFLKNKPPAGITPEALKQRLDSGEEVFLLDIRGETSRKKFGTIEGKTLHYPLFRLHRLYGELPRNKEIVIYDVRGQQAPVAMQYLLHVYFDPGKITWMTGGIDNWTSSGFPVVQEP